MASTSFLKGNKNYFDFSGRFELSLPRVKCVKEIQGKSILVRVFKNSAWLQSFKFSFTATLLSLQIYFCDNTGHVDPETCVLPLASSSRDHLR